MTRRTRIWFVLTVIFFLVNLVGAGYAAWLGEPLHAGVHAVLAIAAIAVLARLKGRQQRVATY